MSLAANHASITAPLQEVTEISVVILLVLGLFTRPVAFIAFAFLGSLWISELGTSWIWELLPPPALPRLDCASGPQAARGALIRF